MYNLVNLLENPRNSSIRFDEDSRGFKYEDSRGFKYEDSKTSSVSMKGLRPALKESFWPEYEYEACAYRRKGTGVKGPWEGLKRGEKVHDQLRDYINMPARVFMERHKSLHPYTKKAIVAMREWGLKPCNAEFILYDMKSRVATRLDALLVDKRGEFTLVDWKCGFDDYMLKGNEMLKGPLDKYSNCPLHQGYLQVLLEKIFLERNYGFTVKNAYVIQITQDGIHPHPMPEKFVSMSEQLYGFFCSSLDRSRDQRASALKRKMWAQRSKKKYVKRARAYR